MIIVVVRSFTIGLLVEGDILDHASQWTLGELLDVRQKITNGFLCEGERTLLGLPRAELR